MSSRYNHKVAEKKWQKEWIEQKIFETKKDISKQKYYVLEHICCFLYVALDLNYRPHNLNIYVVFAKESDLLVPRT